MTNQTPGRAGAPMASIPAAAVNRNSAPYSRVSGSARYNQAAETRRRHKKTLRTVLLTIVAVVVVAAGVAAASAVSFYNSIGERLNSGVSAETMAVLADQQATAQQLVSNWTDTSPFYMLLLGTDATTWRMNGTEEGYGTSEAAYRTDTIILARVDPGNQKLTLVSIHRDTLFPFSWGWDKINSAYPNGGVPLTIQTISQFAGVPISHYAQVNLEGFYAIVDVLGGVEVNVPYEINDYEYLGGHLDAGLQTLNSWQAEIFVRSRHAYDDLGDGDRYRAAHQRLFLSAVLKELLASSPMDMVETINVMANYVNTDLTLDQIVNLALAMRGLDVENDIYSTMNPTTASYENGSWYEYSDDAYWAYMMAQIDAGQKPDIDTAYRSVTDDINSSNYGTIPLDASTAQVVVRNASGDPARAAQVISALQAAGWNVVDGGTANVYLETSHVVYEKDLAAEAAASVGVTLGVAPEAAGNTWMMEGDVMVVVGAW